MSYKYVYNKFSGTLTADISSVATLLPLDAATLSLLNSTVNFNTGEWTYLELSNGVYSEEVRATGIAAGYLVVTRGTSSSTPQPFLMADTTIKPVLGRAAVSDIISTTVVPSDTTVSGTNQALVTQVGNNYNVDVATPNITGDDNINIVGAWPNIQIVYEGGDCGCCGGSGTGESGTGGLDSLVINSEILQGNLTSGILTLGIVTPTFTGSGGVDVTGEWPNYNISVVGGSGGGTVVSVGVGTGLTLTGNPAINPVLSITNTGVTAGDYGGLQILATGQISAIPVGFNPISAITCSYATVVRSGITAAITIQDADVGQKGVVALADHTEPLDAGDTESAVTPALLAASLNTSNIQVAGSSTGEGDASYTNTLTTTNLTVSIAAGEKLLLIGEVEVLDGTTPLTPVAYGIAVFSAAPAKLYGGKICTQSKQCFVATVNGPLTSTIAILTTTLPAGASVQGATLAAIKIPA